MNRTVEIRIDSLMLSRALQAREALSEDVIEDYMELAESGGAFPPIACMDIGSQIVVTDGFHRVEVAKRLMRDSITAIVTAGTWDDALWASLAANKAHGLRRTNADKRRAVTLALSHPAFGALGSRKIADHVGVSHQFVQVVRQQLQQETKPEPEPVDDAGTLEPDAATEDADGVEAAMRKAKESLSAIAKQINGAREALQSLIDASDPAANFVGSQVATDLRNAAEGIKQAMPHKPCPYCHGEGCKSCNGTGWVGRLFWKHAVPEELKS